MGNSEQMDKFIERLKFNETWGLDQVFIEVDFLGQTYSSVAHRDGQMDEIAVNLAKERLAQRCVAELMDILPITMPILFDGELKQVEILTKLI